MGRSNSISSSINPNHNIIQRKQHCVSKADISTHAIKVLDVLINKGYQACLVGGSVRDLLLHHAPKDFDIATNATPQQVRRLFRNARIIGRRFKLVHILFHRETIEVATFRSAQNEETNDHTNDKGMIIRDNVFGTLEEDAWRRDFTINSLYYDPKNATIIDHTGGYQDIKAKQIRIIGDPAKRYQEDPVRMMRALRFCAKLGFDIEKETSEAIVQNAELITHVSSSRLFDEVAKLYHCGQAQKVQELLVTYDFFKKLFPAAHSLPEDEYPLASFLGIALENTDSRIREGKPVTPAFLMAVILWFPMRHKAIALQEEGVYPLPAIEQAMSYVLLKQQKIISIPKRFSQMIREIWIMQFRLDKRCGRRPFNLLEHPRFRAAYDFLALRALAGDESMALADWWTKFQDADLSIQEEMVNAIQREHPDFQKKRRQRRHR